MTKQEIDSMKNIDIRKAKPEGLVEITDIWVDESLPKRERIIDFIRKVKNPYCFKCNGTTIKLEFSPGGITFEEGMVQYLVQKLGSTNL